MTQLQTQLRDVCQQLGLRIVIPFKLELIGGNTISAQALLPQLGAERGMIIVTSFSDLSGKGNELAEMGFGYSVLDEPWSDAGYKVEGCIEMFSEWGWGSTAEKKPDWMRDYRPSGAVRRQADAAATDTQGNLQCQYCGDKLITKPG
jgi:hypothetical protein